MTPLLGACESGFECEELARERCEDRDGRGCKRWICLSHLDESGLCFNCAASKDDYEQREHEPTVD